VIIAITERYGKVALGGTEFATGHELVKLTLKPVFPMQCTAAIPNSERVSSSEILNFCDINFGEVDGGCHNNL
jgi:hypothetical protein